MADDMSRHNPLDPRWPWWLGDRFRFSPPSERYEPGQWRTAVLQHDMVQDFTLLMGARVGRVLSQAAFQERLDDQDRWFPLGPALRALEIAEPPDDLWPLPQPRAAGSRQPNLWIISLDPEAAGGRASSTVFIPLGLVISRLTPVSPRPMAQVLATWLAYRVLPVCTRYGGPATWKALDQMLNPVP
ncbi:hypothetical protein [Candidatus Entotheonella palauensis]|uniref:Uncharacterized protein n=1 Tax=Candidatus Entotheonella gemina TaxID=1429439 RepID=W4LWY6_9BACT|nr:hypothetical protein [Candidatus Entotheonella palauensis]ETX01872.1 MAG: hypothetical protein ETSY2_36555 [Candidatus Entotheonella gemina]